MQTYKVIYLTPNDSDSMGDPVLWCEDRITDQDTKYIRADLVDRLKGYAVHDDGCPMAQACTCGLTELLGEME